jgi:hypothetical protein
VFFGDKRAARFCSFFGSHGVDIVRQQLVYPTVSLADARAAREAAKNVRQERFGVEGGHGLQLGNDGLRVWPCAVASAVPAGLDCPIAATACRRASGIAIERLHEERRIKTQTVLPSAETAAMLFWALLASGQITMRKVDGWQSPNERPSDQIIDLAA